MEKVTTIKVSPETRDRLKALGRKGESYDVVIRRLIYLRRRAAEAFSDHLFKWEDRFLEEALER